MQLPLGHQERQELLSAEPVVGVVVVSIPDNTSSYRHDLDVKEVGNVIFTMDSWGRRGEDSVKKGKGKSEYLLNN